MTLKEEYEICKVRNHSKSHNTIGDQDICRFCGTHYKFVTKIVETNVPK